MSTPEGVDLPVVAWLYRDGARSLTEHGFGSVYLQKQVFAILPHEDGRPLADHAAALSRIRSIQAEVERMKTEKRGLAAERKKLRQLLSMMDDTIMTTRHEVERLRAALVNARARIQDDRQEVWACHVDPYTGRVTNQDGAEWLAEYDDVLRTIDDAMRSTVAPGGQPSEMSK
jgi:septal ring factor EnvC (AmiA/AmiB activator)